jgi:hypothetical protein
MLAHALQEQRPVGQPGNVVVVGQVAQPVGLVEVVERKADVAAQLREQLHFGLIEKSDFVGQQRERGHHCLAHHNGQHRHAGHAALAHLIRQHDTRVAGDVIAKHGLAGAHHGSGKALAGRGHVEQTQAIADLVNPVGLDTRQAHRHHPLRSAVHPPDPGDAEMAVLHRDATGFLEEFFPLAHAHDQGVDAA